MRRSAGYLDELWFRLRAVSCFRARGPNHGEQMKHEFATVYHVWAFVSVDR